MTMRKTAVTASMITAMFAVYAIGEPSAQADELVKGSVQTHEGVPVQNYPVVIQGTTKDGDQFSSFVTTDDNGAYQVENLPPGTYVARPAGEPEEVRKIIVGAKPWYKFWGSEDSIEVKKMNVRAGGTLGPGM